MAYIGNGRTLLVLGSNVRDDIAPDGSTSTFTLSQEVPGGYESNVYVFKQTYITERLITSAASGAITIPAVSGGATQWTITSSNASVAAALSDIKETVKLYSDANHTLTISGSISLGTGTITTSAVSPYTVTGVGTNFTSSLIGLQLYNSSGALIGTVASVASTTSLNLNAAPLVSVSGQSYYKTDSANNGTFGIVSCTYNGSTITITLDRPGLQAATADTLGSLTISRGYSGFWEVLEPDVDYTIGGTGSALNKQITFVKIPKVNDKVYVIHKGDATYNLVPSDNSVGPNQLSQNLRNFVTDKFTGNGTTSAYTLSQSAVNAKTLLVTINGAVKEETTDYNIDSAGTTLTFTSIPANLAKIRVLHLGFSTVSRRAVLSPGQVGSVDDGSITSAKLAAESVIESKIASSAVSNVKLTANAVTSDKILLSNNTSLRSYRVDGTTVFSALTLNNSDQLIVNTPTTAHIAINGTKTVNISSTDVSPETTATISLGTSSKKFTDANLSGSLNSASASITGNITVGGTVDGVDVSAFQTSVNSSISSLQSLVEALVPIGAMTMWTLPTASATLINDRWLVCDGAEINRTTYSSLFSVIGTAFGSGNGTTTFNLPDLRRRAPIGKGDTDTIGNNEGLVAASRQLNHSHSVPAHAHDLSNHTHTLPAHSHGKGTLNITTSGTHTTTIDISHGHTASSSNNTVGLYTQATPAGALDHSHTISGSTTGCSITQTAHSHGMQPSGVHSHTYNYRASTYAGGSGGFGGTWQNLDSTPPSTSDAGSHTHTIDGANANITFNDASHNHGGATGIRDLSHNHQIDAHNHTITVNALGVTNKFDTSGTHTHASTDFSGRVGNTGVGVPDGDVTGGTFISGSPSTNTTGNSSVLTSGTTLNTPYMIVNYIIRAV